MKGADNGPTQTSILGVRVDAVGDGMLIPTVLKLVDTGGGTVAYANAHVLNTCTQDPALREFLNAADLVYCDGNGVKLAARILGSPLPARMTGADWIWTLAEAAEAKLKLFWIGGQPNTTAKAAAKLRSRFPGLEIETDHGFQPRSGAGNTASIERINAFSPDILLVGMGTPEQEQWVAQRRKELRVPVVWCVGATAEVLAGHERRGPEWLTRRAEWLSRLAADPARLWRRYLVGNPLFILRVLRQRLKIG
jgi:N-acetylglucosaminyldiphosphoundecaprenol N-acetyl-beta-D-mannosaminyltransferase